MKHADIIGGMLGIILSFLIFYIASGFPEDQVVRVGPAFFPKLVAVGLGIFSVILLISAYTGNQVETNPGFSIKDPGIQRGIISAGATIIYCLLFEYLGFIVCTFIYLSFLMILLKDRQYIQIAITSITVTAVVYFIFKVLLNITLPSGSLYGF
jgi:putative tricarboxylic transport membrane protein